LERELQTERLSEEQKQAAIQELEKRERDYSRLQRQRLSVEDFEPLKLIGKGAFGEVRFAALRMLGWAVM
jgi:serine/threonine kinase 38